MKFLIVDDHQDQLDALHRNLESCGHQAVEAGNGVEALAVLESESVDAVISDILMPSMDGFRLCREIRKSGKRYSRIPLIVYTATYSTSADRELAERVGADGYFLKPSPAMTLVGAVAQVLQKSDGTQAVRPGGDEESYTLERYNAALVRKLERRNTEDQEALSSLHVAHKRLIDMNEQLEAKASQLSGALDAANRELDSFSFSISHDLRAPLRTISGFAQLLEESAGSKLSEDDLRLVKQVIKGADQMAHLIDGLTDFARTSRAELKIAVVDLDPLVDATLAQLKGEMQHRHIEIRRTPLPKVHGDPNLLRQVMLNLLSNAVKFTGPRLHALIEIGTRGGRANEIVVFVRDNGVGFDPKYSSRLFGVFQRLHRADEFEGAGIGLAKAQRIITRHGGAIWADAATNMGATLFISLPRPVHATAG